MKSEKTTEIPENGELAAFDKKLFYTLSIPHLLADIVLILFSFFAGNQLFSKEGLFFHVQPWQNVAMYSIVTLTVPWYLGYIYVRNSAYYGSNVMRLFRWTFVLMTIMILIHLVRLVFLNDIMGDHPTGPNGFTAVFAVFLLVLGPMMCMGGALQARNEFSEAGEDHNRFDAYKMGESSGAFIMIVLGVAFMIYFLGVLPQDSGPWVVVVAFLGGPLAAVIVFALFVLLMQLLDKIGAYKYLRLLALYTFPFFIISVLVFWSGVAIYFLHNDFGNAGGKISKGAMLFTVCISGLVPFRVIMLFNAPVRLSNLVMGFASLGYFFFQMIQMTG
ncbi:MAG: hypothetical protein ACJ77K_02860 [Bacteroidia bacterium]